jgi:glycosyltransferase involved in cell wall biosynthesis
MLHDPLNGAAPLVSIVILYYKRREIIEETLASAVRQDYPNREVIVVDNHSEDDLRQVLDGLGSQVRLVELPDNVGACAGRNAGIRAARGDVIVVIDDDVCFASPWEVSKIVKTFQERPDMHVLALQVCDPRTGKVRIREWCHTRPYDEYVEQEFETNWFGEGASAFRREVFDRCGLYYEPLYYGAEGHDMVVRILDHGFRVLHTPRIRVNHWASDRGRTVGRQYYFFTRNFIWMAYKDYRLFDGIRFVVPKLLMMVYFAWRSTSYRPVVQGLWDGLRGLRAVRADRTPISRSTLNRIAEHEHWRPNVFARLARHRAEPQI